MPDSDPGLMTIFGEALEQPDSAVRAAYLDRACGGDASLRQRVEALLAAHAGAGRFLEPDVTGAHVPDAHRPSEMATGAHLPDGTTPTFGGTPPSGRITGLAAGTVIAGRYTLVEVIGEGGMGSVYLANQTEPVKRQVALKLIKTGMDSKVVLARFDAERQALAMMDHPNIARVFDGGMTPTGQPFFVMELVHGVPITEYCDTHRLSVAARLQLFVSVCQAVQHAHQKGIIHRDLKPGNVLVTEVDGRPTPKVIDFGVAKATEQQLTDLSFADTGAIVGTPAYMSPEQAEPSSMDIDTRTDVYALGVILYELLVGSPPIDAKQFKRGAVLEMLRMVREVEPPRPSTKLSTADALPSIAANRSIEPAKLSKLLKGELDWVVMKAIEKDRTRRYDTANGFARDIQRYLADEVVEARPPSTGYRLRKFVRRHKGQVIAASLVFLALIGGVVGTALALVEARLQRDAAEVAAAAEKVANEQTRKRLVQVERGVALLGSVFDDLDPNAEQKEGKPLRAILTDRLAAAADQLDAEAVGDALAVANLQDRLGEALVNLGRPVRAIPLHVKSWATRTAANGPQDPDTLASMNRLALAHREAGQYDEAVRLHEECLSLQRTALGPDDARTLASMNNLAVAYQHAGRLATAIPLLQECLRRTTATLGPDDPGTLTSQHSLAFAYQSAGRAADAVRLHEDNLPRQTAVYGPDHPQTLATMNNLALAYQALGRAGDAVRLHEECHRLVRAKLGPNHLHTLLSVGNLARAHLAAGEGAKALPLVEEWLIYQRKELGATSPEFAQMLAAVSSELLPAKQYAAAEQYLRELLAVREKAQPGAWTTFNTRSMLGGALLGQKKFDDAEPLLLAGYEGMKQREAMIPAQTKVRIHEALDRLIDLYTATNKPDEVKKWRAERAKYPAEQAPPPRVKK